MTKNITVGYDGTAPSAEAVEWAAAEAAVRGARLRIISCYRIPSASEAMYGWPATEAVASLMDAAEQNAKEARARAAAAHPGLQISAEVSAGPADLVLVDDAKPDDLVVVGASSHEGAAAFWLGSTPRHVVRHSPCPVVVVRGAASRGRPDRIVVGIDGSAASDLALKWAGDEADVHGVELVVVHGWMYPYLPTDVGASQGRDLTQIDAECVLDRAAELAREQFGVTVVSRLVEASPVGALLDTVDDGDWLVLGSRGLGALKAGLLGSTVNAVLDRAAVPVVVVREAAEK